MYRKMDFLYIRKTENMSSNWQIDHFPPSVELDTKRVYKRLTKAHTALAHLKGIAESIPNQEILVNTLGLQEAKDSSAIENIITTHDELYKSELNLKSIKNLNAKEVQNYIQALKRGFNLVKTRKVLTSSMILVIQEIIEENEAGYRKIPGTTLKNDTTEEIIYTPPQHHDDILSLMTDLVTFINDPQISDLDPLIKMALIHFQFESIHPFYDGNGRTGRIINILYLVLEELLDLPILYLSKYMIKHKSDYYQLLQGVRDQSDWEAWILFMINAVEETSRETITLILAIKELMQDTKHKLRDNYKFYSQDLLNNLFKHPYTRIDFMMDDLSVTRLTASNYLNEMAKDGILVKQRIGVTNYYINEKLFDLLSTR